MSKRVSNKKVKAMICGILSDKSANCDVSVSFINGKITAILDGDAFNFTQGVARFDSSFNPTSDNRASLIVSAVDSTVISISECNPATFDQAGFEALEFTDIGTASELKGE